MTCNTDLPSCPYRKGWLWRGCSLWFLGVHQKALARGGSSPAMHTVYPLLQKVELWGGKDESLWGDCIQSALLSKQLLSHSYKNHLKEALLWQNPNQTTIFTPHLRRWVLSTCYRVPQASGSEEFPLKPEITFCLVVHEKPLKELMLDGHLISGAVGKDIFMAYIV